jgi:hypothetical protein
MVAHIRMIAVEMGRNGGTIGFLERLSMTPRISL